MFGDGNPSFNSTLVQLKGYSSEWFLSFIILFQFYLSSIKSLPNLSEEQIPYPFQFYLSSIKRGCTATVTTGYTLFQFYLSSIKRYL